MKVLISLLGLSPGVVTGAYYALYHGWGIDKSVQVDKVVTLGTSAPGMGLLEDEIAHEFDRWRLETGYQVQYDDTCRLHIRAEDLGDAASVREFREIITRLLREDYSNDEVYLVVAGGRKSMAALAAVAAQLYGHGVQGMYHLYVDKDLEDDGSSDRFWTVDVQRQREVMHPQQGQCGLVEVPYLQVQDINGRFLVTLKGGLEETTYDYLRQHSIFVQALDQQSAEKFWGYIFEEKVALYLENAPEPYRYTQATPHFFPIPGHKEAGDVDVYAIRDEPGKPLEVLVCECKLRLAETPDMDRLREGIRQITGKKRPAMEAYQSRQKELDGRKRCCEWWLVTNMTAIEPEVIAQAEQNNIQIHVATLPSKWQTKLDWHVQHIQPVSGVVT
ncbi:MAG: hypothetical protein FJ026_10005 [Chloroflexi bacterium]|nr:hypothetical protein [Chloroflexota bacterium]